MVDAMVEIDRLVQEKPAPDPIIDTPDERDFAHWQPIIESAATNASSEPGDGNLPLVNSMPSSLKTRKSLLRRFILLPGRLKPKPVWMPVSCWPNLL